MEEFTIADELACHAREYLEIRADEIRLSRGNLRHHFQPASLAREALGSWTVWLGHKLPDSRRSVDEKMNSHKKG